MIQLNIKRNSGASQGVTIVELLLVIVVIGILAAITIVSYAGVTNRANSATARSNAESVQKVAEAANVDNGSYPSSAANLVSYNNTTQLPSALKSSASGTSGALTATTSGIVDGATSVICGTTTSITSTCLKSTYGTKDIIYVAKGTTGGCIGYFDFASGTTLWVYAGNASTPAVTGTSPTATITCS